MTEVGPMFLEWTAPGGAQTHWLTPERPVTIGRGQDCGIVIEDQTVSRLHAEVFAQGPGYVVRNLSRTNPVVLEHYGSVVRLEWGQHAPLQPGARLRLGQAELAARQPLSLRVR